MKKFVIAIAVVALFVFLCGVGSAELVPELYTVIEVNRESDCIILLDGRANYWIWEGAEDWKVGDFALGIFEDWDNDDPFDDEIITLRYCYSWGEALKYYE